MVGRIAAKAAAGGARPLKPKPILHDADASVTHVEVCGCDGVGRLVEMLFDGEPIILSVRFSNPTKLRAGGRRGGWWPRWSSTLGNCFRASDSS